MASNTKNHTYVLAGDEDAEVVVEKRSSFIDPEAWSTGPLQSANSTQVETLHQLLALELKAFSRICDSAAGNDLELFHRPIMGIESLFPAFYIGLTSVCHASNHPYTR